MKFPPLYILNDTIRTHLHDLDVLKEAFALVPLPETTAVNLRRMSILKSSLYSARIEGNPLAISDVTHEILRNPREVHKREIGNILRAFTYADRYRKKQISIPYIRALHAIVLHGLSGQAGHFRQEESAIYNTAGIAVYLTPAPADIHRLLDAWCGWVGDTHDAPPVKAAVSHVWFEKIHPFMDGNGRVGRLLTSSILKRGGFDFGGIVPFEQYLDEHRQEYYDALMVDRQDVTGFVEFFLNALVTQARTSLKEAQNPPAVAQSTLLPRRQEILNIIRDHRMVSFDFIARRFHGTPARTLHYDLQQLMKKGLVKKLGTTRGVEYAPGE